MEGLNMTCGPELDLALRRTFSSSAGVGGVRGLGLDSLRKLSIFQFARSVGSISMGATANSVDNSSWSRNSNMRRSKERRGLQTLLSCHSSYRGPSRWDLARSAGVISNQLHLRRLTQIERHLIAKPWTATRTVSMNAASGGTPPQESFIGKFIEKVIQLFVSLLPSKAVIQKVEDEVDMLADVVKESAKIVVQVADEIEKASNIVEMQAEEVEKLAHKIEEITEEVKKVVDDVADVLEGEKGASSLVDTYQNVKKDASATAAAAAALAEKAEAKAQSGVEDSGSATTATSHH